MLSVGKAHNGKWGDGEWGMGGGHLTHNNGTGVNGKVKWKTERMVGTCWEKGRGQAGWEKAQGQNTGRGHQKAEQNETSHNLSLICPCPALPSVQCKGRGEKARCGEVKGGQRRGGRGKMVCAGCVRGGGVE